MGTNRLKKLVQRLLRKTQELFSNADRHLIFSVYKHLVVVTLAAPPVIAVQKIVDWLDNPVITIVAWIGVAGFIVVYILKMFDEL